MDDPLDLKLLMSQQQQQQDVNTNYGKNCQQELCHDMYTEKSVYDSNRQQKDQQVVQIVMNQNLQVIPQPAHQHVQSSVICSQNDQMTYKRNYVVEPQQMYTVAPASQYQIVAANSRGGTVSIQQPQQQQMDIQTYSAPAYIVTTAPDGSQQLQPIQDTSAIRQEHVIMAQNQIELMPQVPAPVEVEQVTEEQPPVSPPVKTLKATNLKKNRPYKCDKCTASFLDLAELQEHTSKHTGDGPFTCDDCHFTFMFKGHYRSHKARCEKKRAENGGKAESVYVFEGGPVRHKFPKNYVKKSLNEKPAQATNTSQAPSLPITKFNTKQTKFNPTNPTFKRNKKCARLDRPFECDECYASFIVEADLKSHKQKHTGEGPFSCDSCKYVFLFKKLYDAHRRRCDKKHKHGAQEPASTTVVETATIQNQPMQVTFSQVSESPSYVTMEMPSVSSTDVRGGTHEGTSLLSSQSIFESNNVPQGSIAQTSSSKDVKYELVPASPGEIEGMNVKQMINLIKVKPQPQ